LRIKVTSISDTDDETTTPQFRRLAETGSSKNELLA